MQFTPFWSIMPPNGCNRSHNNCEGALEVSSPLPIPLTMKTIHMNKSGATFCIIIPSVSIQHSTVSCGELDSMVTVAVGLLSMGASLEFLCFQQKNTRIFIFKNLYLTEKCGILSPHCIYIHVNRKKKESLLDRSTDKRTTCYMCTK